jgi:hypothetical protein
MNPGDVILHHDGRKKHPGCAICEARERGESTIDPKSAKLAVYVTSDKEYARHYASLWGYGDLYVVRPVGQTEPSDEDPFPSWTCEGARVVSVFQRAVRLTDSQRRSLYRRWKAADEAKGLPEDELARQLDAYFLGEAP